MNYSFWQPFHLGDCMFFIAYARRLLRRYPSFEFGFYCEPAYHEQVASMLKAFEGRWRIGSVQDKPADAISTWIGDEDYLFKHPNQHNYVQMYRDWFDRLSQKIGLENPVKSPADLLMEVDAIDTSHGEFDYLVINSLAQSSQWVDTTAMFDLLLTRLLQRGLRVAKTHPSSVPVHFCTTEAGLNIQQLINFAPVCKRIVGVNNAPMVATINAENFKHTESWHVCDHWTYYTYPRFNHLISVNQLAEHIASC